MSIRIAEAAKLLKVHPQTLRRWDEEGILIPQKMGNQRRYTLEQINNMLKDDDKVIERAKVIYCRVSSAKQSEDLQRQIDFMNKIFPGYEVISDIASGVNFNRNGLNKLIERICNDEIGTIAVSFKDRLARIGFEIIEHLCNIHKCEIIVVNNIETSPEAELVEDLIAITTSFSARIHGLRKYSTKFTTKFGSVEDS